jgi:acyl-coenzyme A thioesterase PaaI-like protein
MEKQPNSRMCFVCGIDNPIGLHLAFYTDDEGRCIAHFRPKPAHQGYPGQLHGGVISSLLDEAMGRVQSEVSPRISIDVQNSIGIGQTLAGHSVPPSLSVCR